MLPFGADLGQVQDERLMVGTVGGASMTFLSSCARCVGRMIFGVTALVLTVVLSACGRAGRPRARHHDPVRLSLNSGDAS